MKKFLIIIAAWFAAISGQAQLLWQMSGHDAKGTSYLFGTHHIAPVSLIDSISGLSEAICSVDAVIGEIDMSIMSNPMEVQSVMMPFIMAPADSTLTRVLSPAQIDSLNSVLGKYTQGMLTAQALDPMKPAMVNTQLAMLETMAAFPQFDSSEQLDAEVQNRARQCGREIIGFETLEQQSALLFGSSVAEQAEELMETVRTDMEGLAESKAKELAEAYLQGNLEAVSALLLDNQSLDGEAIDKLIVTRNNNWILQLQKLLPEKDVLVCVGCGHLIGPDGLIEQLRKLGYNVTPVLP